MNGPDKFVLTVCALAVVVVIGLVDFLAHWRPLIAVVAFAVGLVVGLAVGVLACIAVVGGRAMFQVTNPSGPRPPARQTWNRLVWCQIAGHARIETPDGQVRCTRHD